MDLNISIVLKRKSLGMLVIKVMTIQLKIGIFKRKPSCSCLSALSCLSSSTSPCLHPL